MSDLLAKLRLGTANTKLIKWPGCEEYVGLKILSQQQQQDGAFAAERWFEGHKISIHLGSADEYDSEKASQMLWRALVDPKDMKTPVFDTVDKFRESVTREDKSYLIEEYMTFEKDCSPSPDNMKPEEFDAFLSEVKKTPEEILSKCTSSNTLKRCITTMASQLQNSLSDKSLPTAQSRKLLNSAKPTQTMSQS
jgi:hypothetical protein